MHARVTCVCIIYIHVWMHVHVSQGRMTVHNRHLEKTNTVLASVELILGKVGPKRTVLWSNTLCQGGLNIRKSWSETNFAAMKHILPKVLPGFFPGTQSGSRKKDIKKTPLSSWEQMVIRLHTTHTLYFKMFFFLVLWPLNTYANIHCIIYDFKMSLKLVCFQNVLGTN